MCPLFACSVLNCPKCKAYCDKPYCINICKVKFLIFFTMILNIIFKLKRLLFQNVILFAKNQNVIGNVINKHVQSPNVNYFVKNQNVKKNLVINVLKIKKDIDLKICLQIQKGILFVVTKNKKIMMHNNKIDILHIIIMIHFKKCIYVLYYLQIHHIILYLHTFI